MYISFPKTEGGPSAASRYYTKKYGINHELASICHCCCDDKQQYNIVFELKKKLFGCTNVIYT
jgi:hypothetical protein